MHPRVDSAFKQFGRLCARAPTTYLHPQVFSEAEMVIEARRLADAARAPLAISDVSPQGPRAPERLFLSRWRPRARRRRRRCCGGRGRGQGPARHHRRGPAMRLQRWVQPCAQSAPNLALQTSELHRSSGPDVRSPPSLCFRGIALSFGPPLCRTEPCPWGMRWFPFLLPFRPRRPSLCVPVPPTPSASPRRLIFCSPLTSLDCE